MILVKLLFLVSSSFAALKPRTSQFDVDKERSLGLQSLFNELKNRSKTLSCGDISKAMAWMIRHQRLDLIEELMESRGDPSFLLSNWNLQKILRYFSSNIQDEIIHDIDIENESNKDELLAQTIIKNSLKNRLHLVEGAEVYLGSFSRCPQELLQTIMEGLNPNELMNLMLCCWDMRDIIADLARSKCYKYDEQDRMWTPSLLRLYQHWTVATDKEDERATELILCSNLQVSLMMETIILGAPFKASHWQLYYRGLVEKIPKDDSDKKTFPYWQDSFDGWVKEFASVIQPSILELLIKTNPSIEIRWRTIKYAIERKMRASALLVLIENVDENRTMSRKIASLAVEHGYDSRVVLPCIKAHQLVYNKLYKEELEMAIKYCRNSEDLMGILEVSEINYTTIPTVRTIRRLLDDKFSEECCDKFFEKYPCTQVGQELSEVINKREMSAEFFARLLLSNDQMKISSSMMVKLPGDVSEDLYLFFLSRTNVPLVPQKIVEAMQRKFGEPTIRYMLRSCFWSLKGLHVDLLKRTAIENGYSQELLDFIPSLIRA